VPVVDEGALVGIVSDRDLRSVLPTVLEQFEQADDAKAILARPVTTVMDSNVLSVHPETDLADVVDLMVENRIGAVPVVEADSAKLIGIVSYVDVLNAARDAV
jgi:acetoin utilization protein AcuB